MLQYSEVITCIVLSFSPCHTIPNHHPFYKLCNIITKLQSNALIPQAPPINQTLSIFYFQIFHHSNISVANYLSYRIAPNCFHSFLHLLFSILIAVLFSFQFTLSLSTAIFLFQATSNITFHFFDPANVSQKRGQPTRQ